MGERELIYKDEARRALLRNAPEYAWCINSIQPVATINVQHGSAPKPKLDEFWIARIKYWPGADTITSVVKIHYAWHNGAIQFVPFGGDEGDPVWATNCELFELLEKIEVEKYL
jgi:hypothetical protein